MLLLNLHLEFLELNGSVLCRDNKLRCFLFFRTVRTVASVGLIT